MVRFETPPRHGKTARLMLLGNGEYLVQLVKKYGKDITLGEVIKKENEKGGNKNG